MSILKKTIAISSLVALLAGCNLGNTQTQPEGPIKIGVLAPFSGDAAAFGEEAQIVLDYTASQLNMEKNQVELVYEDGKCTGQDAVTAYQKLVSVDQVDLILGGVCSSESLAFAPLLEADQMLALSGGSSNPDVEGASPYFYTLSYNDNVTAQGMSDALVDSKKVAIITEQNDYNIGIQKVLETLLAEKIVANEVFEKGASDMRNAIEKILLAEPDAIILNPNVGATANALLKQLAESADQLTNVQLVSQIAYMGDESRAAATEISEGMLIMDAPSITSPAMLEFKAALPQATPNLGDFFTATIHDALINLVRAQQDAISKQTSALVELTQNPLNGLVAEGKSFKGHNFLQGIEAGTFRVIDGKAIYQK